MANTPHSPARPSETIRMNINVDKAFYKQLKRQALEEDKTLTQLVCDVLKIYLDNR